MKVEMIINDPGFRLNKPLCRKQEIGLFIA